jgi:hypothetical protein
MCAYRRDTSIHINAMYADFAKDDGLQQIPCHLFYVQNIFNNYTLFLYLLKGLQ